MATLTGQTIASTYPLLLKMKTGTVDGTLQTVQDGDATDCALQVSTGAVASTGTLTSTGNFDVATNKFTVAAASGNTVVAGTLGVTGDVAVNTNKFTVTASNGNTSVAGVLSVAGAFSILNGATLNGNVTLNNDIAVVGTATFISSVGVTGATTLNGAVTLGDAAGDTITVNGTLAGTLQGTPTVSLTSVTLDSSADKVLIQDASDSNKLKIATISNVNKSASSLTALPSAGATATIAHSLAGVPQVLRVVMVVNDAGGDAGYAQNDEVNIESFVNGSGAGAPAFTIYADATNVNIVRTNDADVKINNKSTGALTSITTSDWRLKVYAVYVS